jgi:4-amino-4-deoxy-L-arabinose transferase-like glycosyltransferase
MSELLSAKRIERVGAASIGVLAAVLLLTNLGNPYLWQDEAQTALIAETILTHGVPMGTDGTNFFSQELGVEYGDDYVWKWHTWLSFYLVSGSFAVFGPGTFATRLPFALFGIATVLLTFVCARSLWRDRRAAFAAALMLTLCVPFLLLCRQGRWYSVACFFSLLGLHAYSRIREGERAPRWMLFLAGTLLFQTHYLYCAALLASLLLHSALFDREKLRTVFGISLLVTLLNAPWIAWLSTIRVGDSYAERLLDWSRSLQLAQRFGRLFWSHFFQPLFLLIPLAVAADRWRCGEPPWEVSTETRKNALLLVTFCLVNVAFLGFLAPGGYFRYLAPLAPPAFLLIGLLIGSFLRRSLPLGVAVVVLWVATGPLNRFAYEITHDFDGPIEGIVKFLEQNARPGDTVAITYGDLPLKFYTDLRVVGGLTGEDITAARAAEWIIPRQNVSSREERRVRTALMSYLSPKTHRGYEIDYPDTAFENREDPTMHRYRTERPTYPRVVVYGVKR